LTKKQVNRIGLNEWQKVVGKVEAVIVVNDRVKIVLSITPMLLDIPLFEAKFPLPKTEMNIGILRSDRGYLLRNFDRRPRAPILANHPIGTLRNRMLESTFIGRG